MAEKGGPKPIRSTNPSLADILFRHATPGQFGYSPVFAKKIKKLAPKWLEVESETDDQKKKKLLAMAKEGRSKPTQNKLAKSLAEFVNKKSKKYDPAFHKKIKKIAPNWFIVEICEEKKQKLLALARKGIPRPNQRTHPLGLALHTYTYPNSRAFDPGLVKKLKKIAPDWLVRQQVLAANRKKQMLLEMARKKMPRPITNSRLHSYMRNDPKFAKNIKKLAPHWLKKCSTK